MDIDHIKVELKKTNERIGHYGKFLISLAKEIKDIRARNMVSDHVLADISRKRKGIVESQFGINFSNYFSVEEEDLQPQKKFSNSSNNNNNKNNTNNIDVDSDESEFQDLTKYLSEGIKDKNIIEKIIQWMKSNKIITTRDYAGPDWFRPINTSTSCEEEEIASTVRHLASCDCMEPSPSTSTDQPNPSSSIWAGFEKIE